MLSSMPKHSLVPHHLQRHYKHSTLNAVATHLLSAVPSQRIFQIKMTLSISSSYDDAAFVAYLPAVYESTNLLRIKRVHTKLQPSVFPRNA